MCFVYRARGVKKLSTPRLGRSARPISMGIIFWLHGKIQLPNSREIYSTKQLSYLEICVHVSFLYVALLNIWSKQIGTTWYFCCRGNVCVSALKLKYKARTKRLWVPFCYVILQQTKGKHYSQVWHGFFPTTHMLSSNVASCESFFTIGFLFQGVRAQLWRH